MFGLVGDATGCASVGKGVNVVVEAEVFEGIADASSARRILYERKRREGESDRAPYPIASLITDRKKSREMYVPPTSSCVRMKVCRPGLRPVLDQSIC